MRLARTTSLFLLLLVGIPVAAQDKATDLASALQIVGNGEIAAQLVAGPAKERITGRVSFSLVAMNDRVLVKAFNVVFFGVPQKLLAGDTPVRDPLGLLAFAVVSGKPQTLRYDPQTRRVSGTLRMFADASFLAAFALPARDGKEDLVETPTLPATATIAVELTLPAEGRLLETSKSRLDLRLQSEGGRFEKFSVPPFELRLMDGPVIITVDIGPFRIFESGRRLCVQPVKLLRIKISGSWFPIISVQTTGAGLAFGQRGASTEWSKDDVIFDYRDWKVLGAGSHWVTSEAEMGALRSQVEDDDCIEVFFVNDFDPESLFGGGVTFGAGTASSQIVSSDANARFGIDFTHLAHELGHVVGLRHPDAAATASAVPASTGTLMCPSGFKNDNLKINSQENEDLLSNPLLTFVLKVRGPAPDCDDSAECGPCP